MVGAIVRETVYLHDKVAACDILEAALRKDHGDAACLAWERLTGAIQGFNDDDDTEHEDVLRTLDRAIEVADAAERAVPA